VGGRNQFISLAVDMDLLQSAR